MVCTYAYNPAPAVRRSNLVTVALQTRMLAFQTRQSGPSAPFV